MPDVTETGPQFVVVMEKRTATTACSSLLHAWQGVRSFKGWLIKYNVCHPFGQAKLADISSVLSLSQFLLLPQQFKKM